MAYSTALLFTFKWLTTKLRNNNQIGNVRCTIFHYKQHTNGQGKQYTDAKICVKLRKANIPNILSYIQIDDFCIRRRKLICMLQKYNVVVSSNQLTIFETFRILVLFRIFM